jgi:hypothetical protein
METIRNGRLARARAALWACVLGVALIAACGSDSGGDDDDEGFVPGTGGTMSMTTGGSSAAGSGGVTGSSGKGGPIAGMSGNSGAGGATATGGAGGASGAPAMTDGGMMGDAGMMPVDMMPGECCTDGDCLCHGDAPTELTQKMGPYKTSTFDLSTGQVYYPTDAQPPFAAVAVCGGFLNTGPEMVDWGSFYASYGIVTIITYTGAFDQPAQRGDELLAAIKELKGENSKSGSPLNGKLADRYGTSGYSMGGGGTTIAASGDATLKTSVGLAPYGGTGRNVQVATLLLCGTGDTTAPCTMARGDYTEMPDDTPKMIVQLPGYPHLPSWFGPVGTGDGASGARALAFQKVFLEGDERWKSVLLSDGPGDMMTNIQ